MHQTDKNTDHTNQAALIDLASWDRPSHIVGIGASAGGLEALERLFRAMPTGMGVAFVVIQHLSPDFKSLMDELMMRFTSMPVKLVDTETIIVSNTIYLLAPKKEVVIEGERLLPYDRPVGKQLTMPINVFFRSLAASWADKAIAIVLSGTGTDGSDGVLNIRDAGGAVIVQDPSTAKFDGMPQSAISTGCVDAVLGPEEIPSSISSIVNDPLFVRNTDKEDLSDDDLLNMAGIDRIYGLLRSKFDIDFRLYKPSTITRRIHRRITLGGQVVSIDDYVKAIEENPEELSALYKDLLIGVTAFFRDIDAFEALRTKAIQTLLDNSPVNQEFRVWVCGCSTGQEAYSLTMLILEEFERRGRSPSLKVFATDLHKDSVSFAADGVYSDTALESVPEVFRQKYFQPLGDGNYKVVPRLRRFIIFSEHNLLKNPPFTRMNLVSCRNMLIYFRAEAQVPAVTAFNFALVSGGVLFLGASETLGTLADDFDTVDNHWKIYRKTKESRVSLSLSRYGDVGLLSDVEQVRGKTDRAQPLSRLHHHLLERHVPSGILLSENFDLLHVFGDAHKFLKIPSGRHTGDIFVLLGQSLSIALSTALRNIKNQPVSMSYRGIRIEDSSRLIELTLDPLYDKPSGRRFFMVHLREQPEVSLNTDNDQVSIPPRDQSNSELSAESEEFVRQLQFELQRTKEALQTNAEELETSNEEVQASNEELQASNEELQSTNEELHSVNEELYTVNSELEAKLLQLDRITSDLKNLVDSTQIATVFLDSTYQVRIFTPRSIGIFSLSRKDIGRDIRNFKPSIPDKWFENDMGSAYSSGETVERELKHAGKHFIRRCTPLVDKKGTREGLILTYIDISNVQISGVRMLMDGIRSLLEKKPG